MQVGGVRWAFTESDGSGDLWVTFHGYGQRADLMAQFFESMPPTCRGLHFDLPHHGETTMDHETLHPNELVALMSNVLRDRRLERCSLLAFSLGGKVALKLLELMPGKITQVVLIAPDGLRVNPLYRFTANTRLGGWLYGRVTNDPKHLFAAARYLRASRILHPKIEQFMHRQLDSREKRERVYKVWRAFRLITPDLREIRSKIVRYGIGTLLVFGEHDRIIRPELGQKLRPGSTPLIRILLVDRGHGLLHPDVASALVPMLRA